ncbi:MAG: DUF1353 domain-containing protein [Thermodesulfobacteriota bacterium]
MSSFTEPLRVEQIPGTRLWATLRELEYYAGREGSDEVYRVPAFFRTDFASVPRLFWTLVGHPAGRYAAAAVLHDWLYDTAVVSRARADALFLEGMGVLGVRRSQRWALYLGVRVGGWAAGTGGGIAVADEGDRASAREEELRADALAAWRRGLGSEAGGRQTCLDCGDPIPRARREAVPGCRRCRDCEADTERRR